MVDSASQELRIFQSEAQKELDEMDMVQKFELTEVLTDKSGEKTKVLEIDLDKKGIIGMILRSGNPVSYDSKGEISISDESLIKYVEFMSNIELTDDNLDLIGWTITKAREAIKGFFMLRLVLSIDVPQEQANTSSS